MNVSFVGWTWFRIVVSVWSIVRRSNATFVWGYYLTISIFYHPLLLLPSIFPSIRVFSSESALCIRWQKYWSFSFSNSPFNEYSGLISFRIDWFDLLAVQGTLKSLLQHRSSKASILLCSAFLTVQRSRPHVPGACDGRLMVRI